MMTTGALMPFSDNADNGANLEKASKLIEQQMSRENSLPELWDLFHASFSRDYAIDSTPLFEKTKLFVLPEVLYQQYEKVECKCFMGLFPQIGRAWLSIDEKIYLWNFRNGMDICCIEEVGQVIISVGLVKPKSDVFVSEIEYLLILATPLEIVLIGLTFGDDGMKYYPTNLKLSSDNVNILSVQTTENGRIFMCGSDGNLYEFVYQAEEGWFTRKCRKLNHTSSSLSLFVPTFLKFQQNDPIYQISIDSSRSLLFSLSESNLIQVFTFDGEQNLHKIAENSDVFQQALRLCPRTSLLNHKDFSIVSIHAIDKKESKFINLVAVTCNGIRLYFSTLSREHRNFDKRRLSMISDRGSTCELIHVRLPPESSAQPIQYKQLVGDWISNIHTAFYRNGVFLAANAVTEDEDSLWLAGLNQSQLCSPLKTKNMENYTEAIIEGKIWAIDELSQNCALDECLNLSNELASQNVAKQREFLVLTNSGIQVLSKKYPVDILNRILMESQGHETEDLKNFFQNYTRDQSCAMCLSLACNSSYIGLNTPGKIHSTSPSALSNHNVSLWASYAFFRYGGEARFAETIVQPSRIMELGVVISEPQVNYSGIHNGLLIYFSYLLKPLWEMKLLDLWNMSRSKNITEQLLIIQNKLTSLAEFIKKTPNFFANDFRDGLLDPMQKQRLDEAYKLEKQSIIHIQRAIQVSAEAISFCLFLFDNNLNDLIHQMTNGPALYGTLEFSFLVDVSKGKEFVGEIMNLIIRELLRKGANIDSLCEILKQKCPTFFNADEVFYYKGFESLQKAIESSDMNEKDLYLVESLRFFEKSIKVLSTARLAEISREYQRFNFHPAVIQLVLLCAESSDPLNLSHSYYLNEQKEGQEKFQMREKLYKFAFSVISDLMSKAPLTKQIEDLKKSCFLVCFSNQDELFHIQLFDWLIANGYSEELINSTSPFVERYLISCYEQSIDLADLLWKHYGVRKEYLKAAKFLLKIALDMKGIALDKRLYYLTLAMTNAKSVRDGSAELSDFIVEIEERLQIARLQSSVLSAVRERDATQAENLEYNILSISELFNMYTSPMNLPELSLQIIDYSGHQDATLVNQLWTEIINQAQDNMALLSAKIVDTCRKLSKTAHIVPLDSLVMILEKMCLMKKDLIEAGWLPKTLLSAQIAPHKIFESLNRLVELKITPWNGPSALLFLLDDIRILFELSSTDTIPSKVLNDCVSNYLLQLTTLNIGQEIMNEFRVLQRKLSSK